MRETRVERPSNAASQTSENRSAGLAVQTKRNLATLPMADQERALSPNVQRRGAGTPKNDEDVHQAAASGVQGAGGALPHLEKVQRSFGRHDLGGVKSHVGGAAANASDALGAKAYASGESVAFRDTPDLHTVAHEAAHVIQQRRGVSLDGGVGRSGDGYEQQADQVADAVVRGDSVEPLLGPGAGGPARGSAVQREDAAGTPKPRVDTLPGLKLTGGGVISDWAVAVTTVAQKWNRISERQQAAAGDFYEKAKEDDPPPAWVGILKAAISIGLGAATGGIGAVVVSKLTDSATKAMTNFIVNSAVEAGKGVVGGFVTAGLDLATANDSSDGLLAYKIAQQDAIGNVVDRESEVTAEKMDTLAQEKDAAKRWGGLQQIYDALESSRAQAYQVQFGETLEGWFSSVAKNTYGRNDQGTSAVGDDTTDIDKMDLEDTSLVGTLGLRLEASGDPTKRLKIDYVNIEGSKGNNEKTRSYFLNSPKKIKDFRMPKTVLAQSMPTAGRWTYGSFLLAWDEAGASRMVTYGGAQIDGSNDNAGRSWVAMYGMNVNRDLSEREVNENLDKGLKQIERDVLDWSFKSAGVTKITT